MNSNFYAILMAGGVGSRFWPVSKKSYPKQFHDLLGSGQSLLQHTFSRLARFIPKEHILILTNADYRQLVLDQLPDISLTQIVEEPAMRNTAPCILYAALKIQKMNPNACMVVAPSDHWIEDETAFEHDVRSCFDAVSGSEYLCTLGIQPTFPNTGFGYIEFEKGKSGLTKVLQFREKPNYATAKKFLEQGNFLWNAGIFAWSVGGILAAFEQFQPKEYAHFLKGLPVYNTEAEAKFIAQNYPEAANISIDYAIMEQSNNVLVLPASFDWNDLGTWGSLYDKMDKDQAGNANSGGAVLMEQCTGNMIKLPQGKIAVLEGLNDFIVVDSNEVLLIVPKNREQEIKQWVSKVKDTFGPDFI
ncbi:MAG: hypothetical protein RLZZ241_550 [Bacteroidota bacterium]|jgi:mannose-1-phosphate guanylyltransferase